jgi:hypothetical protein
MTDERDDQREPPMPVGDPDEDIGAGIGKPAAVPLGAPPLLPEEADVTEADQDPNP